MCAIDEEALSKISGAIEDFEKKGCYKCPKCGQSSFLDVKSSEEKHTCPHCGYVWHGIIS